MSTSTTRTNGSWLNWGPSKTTERNDRRKTRARRGALRRLEALEDRTLLNASIDIDAAGVLTYHTDGAVVETLNISVAGDVYTFASTVDIDVLTNLPGLTVTGDTTPTVTVTGISGLVVDADFADDSVAVASSNVDTTINLNTTGAVASLGDPADPLGLAALSAPITVTGQGPATPSTLNVIDAGSTADVDYTLTSSALSATNGFGGLTYSDVASLNITSNNGSGEILVESLPASTTVTIEQGDGDHLATVSIPEAAALATTLDGGAGNNALTLDAGDLALEPGFFSAGPGGTTVIAGIVLPGGPITYSNYQQVTVTNLPPATPPIVTGATINAVQGQQLVDAIAGTFTTSTSGASASDFTATIDWGDGTSSAGVIVQDASDPSVFYVMGTHTYAENSPSLTTTVTVSANGGEVTEIINDVPVTFVYPAGGTASADGTAVVDNAPINLSVNSFAGVENVTPNPLDVVVATFTDLGGVAPGDPDPTARYVATIDWGDGSGATTIPTSAITQNGTSNSFTITLPQHVYATPGTYVVTVTVSDGAAPGAQDPVTATATGVAHVADAPLTAADPQPTIVDATEGVLFVDEVIGSFTDANPLATPGEYSVTIDWGDGSPMSYGRVVQPAGAGTPFFVVGTHTYADAKRTTSQPNGAAPVAGPVTAEGTYAIRIFVQDAYGSAANLANTITVLDRPLTLTGKLNPASDSGASNSDAITNVQQPNFFGAASEPGALVFLYATPFGGTAMLIGQTVADASGAWSITSNVALTDGGYEIQAQAYDASGNTISALTNVAPNLVIDTVGPKIADVFLDNLNGQALVTFADFGGVSNLGVGVLQSSLIDANNYRFSMVSSPVRGYRGAPQWLVTGVNVQPGTNVGQQLATVLINDGRPFRGGRFNLNVLAASAANASGVRDIAGNALDGEFYSYFPSGNNVPGGDFATRLDVVHDVHHAPRTLIGPATPVSPPGQPGRTRIVGRDVARPRGDLALRLASARAARAELLAARVAGRPRLAARFG